MGNPTLISLRLSNDMQASAVELAVVDLLRHWSGLAVLPPDLLLMLNSWCFDPTQSVLLRRASAGLYSSGLSRSRR
jgi:hypothetical protein